MHPCCITVNNIVKHAAPIVAQRVQIFPGCVACAAHAVLEAKPVNNNDKEEVQPRPPCIVSFLIDDEYELKKARENTVQLQKQFTTDKLNAQL
jgi:hypothetical protein